MRNLSYLVVALFLLQLTTFAQTKWYKYAGNPVFEKGEPGEWDASHVRYPVVLWDGTQYNMWYSGEDGGVQAMGYAWSNDGIHWTKDILNNPVLERGAPGSWDDDFIAVQSVLFDSTHTHYKLWYIAGGGKTGLATSPNEIEWTKDTLNNPVLTGTPGTWDENLAVAQHVIKENSIYKMWYAGGGYNSNLDVTVMKIGYAESDSGITWIKHPDPVLEEGDYVTWANDLTYPFVIHEDSNYTMWYVSSNTLSGASHGEQINYATSPDEIDWTKDTLNNPVLSRGISPEWDFLSVWKPVIIKENNLYKMWYTGETSQVMSIGYAEDFSNLVHADSVIIEDTYVIPNTDTLNILGRVKSPEGHAVSAKAFIISDDGSTQDSVELFDDGLHGDGTAGDGIYGGYWPVPNENETNYTVGIKTVDLETGFTRNGLNWNIIDRFTTKGPIKFENLEITSPDTIANPGDRIKFKLTIKNYGLTDTVYNAEAKIILYDYPIRNSTFGTPTYGDIAPGESLTNSSSDFALTFADSCNPGSYEIGLEISSNDEAFWYDIFTFDVVTGVEDQQTLPISYKLFQNFPNPFNPVTTIDYHIPELSFVTLKIYDVLGNEIATLVNEEKPAGEYEVEFNPVSSIQYPASGIYFYRLKAGSFIQTKKMLLIK